MPSTSLISTLAAPAPGTGSPSGPGRPPLDFTALRTELGVPGEFPAAVLAEAEAAAAAVAAAAADAGPARVDRTDIPFVTVDPVGSKDLDQAVHIAREADGGYLVSYAIADVATFVRPGGALDAEVSRRGETLYFPDLRVPLHPAVLSEGAASLLPGQVRPTVLWQITLDPTGRPTAVRVARALARSVRQLDYAQLQGLLDAHQAPDAVALLGEVGARRGALARARQAITLDLPEQEVEHDPATGWRLRLRAQLPVEGWNAEISLLTGMCAADIMLRGGIGVLRTLPAPDPGTVEHLRRIAGALDVDWPAGAPPSDVLAGLDRMNTRHVAFVEHAASLLRGAGYTPFNGAAPPAPGHAGVGAPYAHVTAPLRRLVDRYGSEICLALQAGQPVPDWARTALPGLPEIMRAADQRAHAADRAVLDTVEAWLLQDRIGETFQAVVLDAGPSSAKIAVDTPAVRATCEGSGLVEGTRITVRLATADVASRTVRFTAA